MTRGRRWHRSGLLFLAVICHNAPAQNWPVKAIRVIVPFTAGSATDVVARTVTERLSLNLGRAIVVENRPGAGGTIGAAIVAKADPDGYTVLVQSASHTVTPTTYPSLPYDTERDLAGVTPLAMQPNVLVVAPSKGYTSVRGLVTIAQAHPGTINYASAGMGSATHLNAERFRLAAHIDAQHVPFKGTPEALTEVLTGRVDYYFCPVVSTLSYIHDGKLLALAVGSAKRSAVLPDIPTTVEAGVPNSAYNFWVGMFVPGKTPRAIVARLHDEVIRAIDSEDVRQRFARLGAEPFPLSPEQFDDYVHAEIVANAELIKAAHIKTE